MSTIPYHTTPYHTVPHHTKAINKYTGSWWARGAEFLLPPNPSPASWASFNEKWLFQLIQLLLYIETSLGRCSTPQEKRLIVIRRSKRIWENWHRIWIGKVFKFGETRGIFACIHYSLNSKAKNWRFNEAQVDAPQWYSYTKYSEVVFD